MRRLSVGFAAVVVLVGVTQVQGALSPWMFLEPVPVLMDPAWVPDDNAYPRVTADGEMLAFIKHVPMQVHTAEWNESNQRWENVEHVTGLGQSWTATPCISPDKQWLFYTGSSGTHGTIYRSPWLDDHWGPGERIDPVNDPFAHLAGPYFNGSRLYFNATNILGGPTDHIYYSEYDPVTDSFGTPIAIDPIDDDKGVNLAGYGQTLPSLTPDGQTLFWQSNRPEDDDGNPGEGGWDIWMSNWESGSWGKPINAGPLINTAGNEGAPSYNGARNSLYFYDSDLMLVESNVIPEPSTLVLLGMGAIALLLYALRRRR